ncbi:hypothetical protein U1707_00135 [Sphingomonas sp. PB2P12]|uniref:hypothetical protein n=1 Tax=Sphingomonas sandaracina TaxID=3096157 RepID=UPI002FC9B46C
MRFPSIALGAVLANLLIGSADAQSGANNKSEFRFDLSPAIGESLRETEGNQPVDESEVALGFRFIRSLTDSLEVQATPSVGYSPQVYDKNDPSSQARVGFEIRRRMFFGSDQRPLPYTSVGKISAQAFARYSPSLGFANAFGDHAFFDNGLAGGVRLANDVWFHCRQRWIMAVGLGCNPARRVAVQFTPSLQYLVSDKSARRRLVPQADASLVVPLRDINIRLASRFENRRFSDLKIAGGGRQRDGRITASLSFDFAPAIPKLRRLLFGDETGKVIVNDFTLEVGARYVRNRSNNTEKNFDRIFFVPAFSYTRQLD